MRRLRLSSIDSIEADDDLLDAIADEPRLMPHLHLSLQAGDDMILKRMKRRHLRDDSIRFCAEVRRLRPDIVFGADIIAGFPTETEDDVRELARHRRGVRPHASARLSVLARAPERRPRACRSCRASVVKERAARLRAAGGAAHRRHLEALAGTRQSILVERDGLGRTEGFALAAIDAGRPGEIVAATISGHDGARLIAVPVALAA